MTGTVETNLRALYAACKAAGEDSNILELAGAIAGGLEQEDIDEAFSNADDPSFYEYLMGMNVKEFVQGYEQAHET